MTTEKSEKTQDGYGLGGGVPHGVLINLIREGGGIILRGDVESYSK